MLARNRRNTLGIFTPQCVNLADHLGKRLRWHVKHRVQRITLRRQKDIERPAPSPLGGLDKRHQCLIQRGLQFAVHFDGNEVTIEDLCDVGVLITLILHHMTPVAGKIPHRNIHQLVLALRSSKGLGTPFLPRHRIIAMQSQVG